MTIKKIDFRFDLSEIHSDLKRRIEFTRTWFEEKLEITFDLHGLDYIRKRHEFPNEKKKLCKTSFEPYVYPPFDDVDIVFLAGGTCRIPFIQKWIGQQFPNAEIIIDGELEVIAATGAIVHALQVLNKETEPFVEINEQESDESDFNNKQLDEELDEKCSSLADLNLDEDNID